MHPDLQTFLEEWGLHRKLTLDLLDSLSEEKLDYAVAPNMGPLRNQFRHIARIQSCYINAIRSRKMDFSNFKRRRSRKWTKKHLKILLSEFDRELSSLLKRVSPLALKNLRIQWREEQLSLLEHVRWIINHELLHHG